MPTTNAPTVPSPRAALVGLLALSLLATGGGAGAQTTTTRSQDVASGKSVRLVIAPNLKKDCTSGPVPEIKVVTAPKNGSVTTRGGKLKTPASYRCPDKEAQVQAVFYRSKPGFAGSDAVLVEIKTADGAVERQDIRITVDASKPDDAKKKESTDL